MTMWTLRKLRKTRPVLDRFCEKISEPTGRGCLLWNASSDPSGYGLFYLDGKLERAHRVGYKLFYGSFPDQNACHTCDIRLCVNPLHLFDGSQGDNMRDMVRKGRHGTVNDSGLNVGVRNPRSKLSSAQVAEIRSLYTDGTFTQGQLVQMFGVSQTQISRIVRRELWKVS